MSIIDTDEQCVLEYEGQWFLLQRYLRSAALEYFRSTDDELNSDGNFIPEALPAFLIPISDPSDLIFFKARTPTLPGGMFEPAVFKS